MVRCLLLFLCCMGAVCILHEYAWSASVALKIMSWQVNRGCVKIQQYGATPIGTQ